VVGASGELDRQVLERMLPPFEHMLRNSVVHGIETPEERVARGKSESGTIRVGLHREGSEMVIILEDDGRWHRRQRGSCTGSRARAAAAGRVLSDEEALQLISSPASARRARSRSMPAAASAWTSWSTRSRSSAAHCSPNRSPGRA
jgi:chemosensory pili system protein ChpA (sensor histidine kinase/response regulator)